jgi:predicted dehydrogenase
MHPIRLAVCHLEEATCAAIAARLRGATVEVCRDLASLSGCDAVLLGESGAMQAATAVRLFSKKIHVLVVAAPCPPWSAIEALSGAARTAGVQFVVVNPDRYLPSRQLLSRQVPDVIGEPGLIRLHRWGPAPSDPHSGTTELPDPLLRDLDTVLGLTGRQPNSVYAIEQGPSSGRYVQVHLGFSGGPMALLDYTDRLPAGDEYHSLSVIAARGAAYADDHQNMQLLYRGGHPQALRTEERAGQYAAIIQSFVEDLRAGRDRSADTAAWRGVFQTADAVRRSLASARALALEGP